MTVPTQDSSPLLASTGKKSFLEHLDELRSTIVKIALSIVMAAGIAFYFAPVLIHTLKLPLIKALQSYANTPSTDHMLRSLHPTGTLIVTLKMTIAAGIIIALPLILFFIGQFLLPALTRKEKTYLLPVFTIGGALFVSGIAFCFFLVLPLSLKFLWGFSQWMHTINDWTLEYYISFVTRFLLVFGLAFETPMLLLTLVKLHILSYEILQAKRKVIIVIIFVLAALLTPPDVLTQILMALPLLLLYEISIWGAYIIDKKRKSPSKLAG